MSNLSYHVGYALGTVTREFLREVRKPVALHSEELESCLPGACLPSEVVDALSSVPAIVRTKGIDLHQWYEANTRPIAQPARKRRSKESEPEAHQAHPTAPALGCLADLI